MNVTIKFSLSEQGQKASLLAGQSGRREQVVLVALGLGDDEVIYRVESGCLSETPIWESHKGGKNWLAIITLDPHSPGGLARDFQTKCKGGLYYDAVNLVSGTPVEFGADYYSYSGRKSINRWYGVVARRVTYRPNSEESQEYVVFVQHDTGKAAVKAVPRRQS